MSASPSPFLSNTGKFFLPTSASSKRLDAGGIDRSAQLLLNPWDDVSSAVGQFDGFFKSGRYNLLAVRSTDSGVCLTWLLILFAHFLRPWGSCLTSVSLSFVIC